MFNNHNGEDKNNNDDELQSSEPNGKHFKLNSSYNACPEMLYQWALYSGTKNDKWIVFDMMMGVGDSFFSSATLSVHHRWVFSSPTYAYLWLYKNTRDMKNCPIGNMLYNVFSYII